VSEDEDFAAKVRSLLDANDRAAAQVCENYKAPGVQGYMVREVDAAIETDASFVRVLGPINQESPDIFRRGASLCERYLRARAQAN
jgi:hypothetical protein